MIRFFAVLIVLLGGATIMPVAAQEPQHAMVMHGQPKYDAGFDHLDYVRPDAPKGGTLTQAEIGTFDTLNPYNIKGKKPQALEYNDLTLDPLMRRVWDEPFSLYGLIAQEVIIPEDRSEITYILNPKAQFHDGHPITAEDVAFSFEQHKEIGKPVTRRVYGLVDHYEVLDDHRIRFVLGEGYDAETAMILSLMRVLPKHYWQDKDLSETTLEPSLGSGPYRVSEVDAGRKLVLERVEDYWAADLPVNRGQYNFDRLVYDFYRDKTVAFQAFKAGEVDMWRESDIGNWLTNYEGLDEIEKVDFRNQRPAPVEGFIFNTRRDLFSDIKVREALTLAFPYEWVRETIYHSAVTESASLFSNSPYAPIFKPKAPKSERQLLREAMGLLKEAGWSIESNKLQKNGQVFEFEILLQNPKDERIALAYKQALKKLGIEMSVRVVDSAQFFDRLNGFDYDMVSFRWINSLSPGNEQAIYWGSAAADMNGTRNYAGVKDEAVDAAIGDLVNAKTKEELETAIHALDRAVMTGHYFIPLFFKSHDYIAVQDSIGYPPEAPIYGPVIETWWQK